MIQPVANDSISYYTIRIIQFSDFGIKYIGQSKGWFSDDCLYQKLRTSVIVVQGIYLYTNNFIVISVNK